MTYIPKHAVWEITYACNMNCKHCGSGCGQEYPDELTTNEALQLCDDIADLGLGIITLSGGEPFVREDCTCLQNDLRGAYPGSRKFLCYRLPGICSFFS